MIRGWSPWEQDEHEHPNIKEPEQPLGTNREENIFTGLTHHKDKPFLDGDPGTVSCEEAGIFMLRKHAFQPMPSLFPGSKKPQAAVSIAYRRPSPVLQADWPGSTYLATLDLPGLSMSVLRIVLSF